ncbi:MAG: hypothetical protein PVJ17_12215 [Lysobacterales bacterium]|jgi:hypothetical protein
MDRAGDHSSACERVFRALGGEQGRVLVPDRLASRLSMAQARVERCLEALERDGRVILLPRIVRDGGGPRVRKVYIPGDALRTGWDSGRMAGANWEATVVGAVLAAMPKDARAGFFRDAEGAEMDLVLEFPPDGVVWAIEIKLRSRTRLRASFHRAFAELEPERAFLVHTGDQRFRVMEGVEAIGLEEMTGLVKSRCKC